MLAPRLQITSKAAARYLGFAKVKLRALTQLRTDLNLPSLQRKYRVDGFRIEVISAEWYDTIRIFGGSLLPEILLGAASGRHTGYRYSTDVLVDGFKLDNIYGQIGQGPGGYMFVDGTVEAICGSKWSIKELESALSHIGYMADYDMTLFEGAGSVVARRLGVQGTLLDISGSDYEFKDMHAKQGGLFGVSLMIPKEAWNRFRPVQLVNINPANGNVLDGFYWQPNFFTAQPADMFGLPYGFYYGHYPNSYYDFDQALETCDVKLKAICDTRVNSSNGEYNFGYAEMVTNVNGEDKADLFLYMQYNEFTAPANPNFAYVKIQGSSNDQVITTGADLQGKAFSFVFHLDTRIDPDDYDVYLWNFRIWTNQDSILPTQDTGVGVIIANGRDATVYRYSGYAPVVYETSNYHSHSYSDDGSILAIFESEPDLPNIISRVKVFDLFGVRDGDDYSSGGFTEIRDSEVVATVEALHGEIIPFHAEDFERAQLTYGLGDFIASQPPDDNIDYAPSLAIVRFIKSAEVDPVIMKVICTDGVNASYGISTDNCFQSTMVVENPDKGVSEEKLVGTWQTDLTGSTLKGVLRGEFTGDHPDMIFEGEGEEGKIYYTAHPESTFLLGINATYGNVEAVSSYIGDLEFGDCVVEDERGLMMPDPDCYNCDGGEFSITASSSCGQRGELIIENPSSDTEITATVDTDGLISISGTSGTVTVEGSVTESEAGLKVIDLCSWSFTVSTSCGQEATFSSETTGALTLTGETAPLGTETYVPSGGMPPYSFSLEQEAGSDATISSSGVLSLTATSCGNGTITVEDACGDTASLTVSLENGKTVTYEGTASSSDSITLIGGCLSYCETFTGDKVAAFVSYYGADSGSSISTSYPYVGVQLLFPTHKLRIYAVPYCRGYEEGKSSQCNCDGCRDGTDFLGTVPAANKEGGGACAGITYTCGWGITSWSRYEAVC